MNGCFPVRTRTFCQLSYEHAGNWFISLALQAVIGPTEKHGRLVVHPFANRSLAANLPGDQRYCGRRHGISADMESSLTLQPLTKPNGNEMHLEWKNRTFLSTIRLEMFYFSWFPNRLEMFYSGMFYMSEVHCTHTLVWL